MIYAHYNNLEHLHIDTYFVVITTRCHQADIQIVAIVHEAGSPTTYVYSTYVYQ